MHDEFTVVSGIGQKENNNGSPFPFITYEIDRLDMNTLAED